jgi:diphthamide biosynthesis protein 3
MEEENIYDTIEIEDMNFDKRTKTFYYPCPCGDRFAITLKQMKENFKIAECPSCSLKITVVYDQQYLERNFKELLQII